MEIYKNHFNKISLFNAINNHIINYGVSCGYETLPDYVDMNCGAIPEGEFNQVIDESAPEQFLSLYTKVVEARFAYTVTKMLSINEGYMGLLSEFYKRTGSEMGIEPVANLEQALEIYDFYIVDGMPGIETKKILQVTPEKIVWEKTIDTHEEIWNKAGGKVSVYYQLINEFVNGMFEASGIKLEIENGKIFTLVKKQQINP